MLEGTFNDWWNCNKDGDFLKDAYSEYLYDCEQSETSEKVLSFKQWAKQRYKYIVNSQPI